MTKSKRDARSSRTTEASDKIVEKGDPEGTPFKTPLRQLQGLLERNEINASLKPLEKTSSKPIGPF
jgi:hypothetical protein